MIKYTGIITNAVEETQNYLNKIIPSANFQVKAGKQVTPNFIDIDVYVQQPVDKRNIRTLVAELNHLEDNSQSFKYTIRKIPAKQKAFFNEKTNPKFVGSYPGV